MRKHANIFKALAFGLMAFAFYEVKASHEPELAQVSISDFQPSSWICFEKDS